MTEQKERNKARKRIFKCLKDSIESLEKAEDENTDWQFVPRELFKEIIEVLGKIETELTKTEP